MIQAMMQLSSHLGKSKGMLREVEMGEYQIGIAENDLNIYVVIQDKFDNEPFTRRILDLIIDKIKSKVVTMNLINENKQEIKEEIYKLVNTLSFPKELLPRIGSMFTNFDIQTFGICDTIFISDLDDGVVSVIKNESKSMTIINVLMIILSELPFEKNWVAEMKLENNKDGFDYELWFIQRIGGTDFCILGRAYHKKDFDKNTVVDRIEQFADSIHNLLLSNTQLI